MKNLSKQGNNIPRKSSFSSELGTPQCVLVAISDAAVKVSSSWTSEYILEFTPGEWKAFINGVKAGEFDLDTED